MTAASRRIDCLKPTWVLPDPPVPFDRMGRYGDEVVVEAGRVTIEEYPITKSAGGDTSDDPSVAAIEARDNYWEEPDSRAAIRRLVRRIRACRPIDPAIATADADTGRVGEFDGGHRLRAAMIAGLKTMPVAVEWTRGVEIVDPPEPRPRLRP